MFLKPQRNSELAAQNTTTLYVSKVQFRRSTEVLRIIPDSEISNAVIDFQLG
jgi:hypothetical protein